MLIPFLHVSIFLVSVEIVHGLQPEAQTILTAEDFLDQKGDLVKDESIDLSMRVRGNLRIPSSESPLQPREEDSIGYYHPDIEGDPVFIDKLEKFRHRLCPDSNDLDRQLISAISRGDKICDLNRQVTWFPVQCRSMNVKFHVEARIVDEGPDRNAVYRVRDVKTRKLYAYKLFGKADDYTSEVAFYTVISNHPNIAKPVCTQRDSRGHTRPGLVLEYIEGESSLIVARNPTTTVKQITLWSAKLLNVLGYIHQKGFVHADLKPDNIMIKPDGDLVVFDFGFAMPLPFEHPNRGNHAIKAPELSGLVSGRLHEGIDMWAYGSTIATWFGFKYLPNSYLNKKRKSYVMVTIGNRKSYKFHEIPHDFPDSLKAVIYLMTAPNPNLRTFAHGGTFALLRNMPFFADIDWDVLDRDMVPAH